MRVWTLLPTFLFALAAPAQEPAQEPAQDPAQGKPQVDTAATASEPWSFSFAAYNYSIPGDRDYVQPTLMADRDWLHLEARYNYEDLDTGSLWVGYNLSAGEEVALEFTPMLGGVFGDTNGVAPGYRGSLSWWQLELYSEGEYLFDTDDSSDSYFYNWSELTWSPLHWLRLGTVVQRTRVYGTESELERGLLVGVCLQQFNVTAHVFDLDESEPTVVLSFGVDF